MKKISLSLVFLILLSLFACCTNKKSEPQDEVKKPEPTIEDIANEVVKAYGEDYLPSRRLTNDEASEQFGFNKDDVEEIYAEVPLISAHVDIFIAIKAKPNKGENIEKALMEYQKMSIEDTMQYPQNNAKIKETKVFRKKDYVFFVRLGKINEKENVSENDDISFAKEQIKIGTDKINTFFNS